MRAAEAAAGIAAQGWETRASEAPTDVVTDPSHIIEVLSPGAESYDRAQELAGCPSVETLPHHVMVSSQEVMVEQCLRQDDGRWMLRRGETATA